MEGLSNDATGLEGTEGTLLSSQNFKLASCQDSNLQMTTVAMTTAVMIITGIMIEPDVQMLKDGIQCYWVK